jgi:hypothetical protein
MLVGAIKHGKLASPGQDCEAFGGVHFLSRRRQTGSCRSNQPTGLTVSTNPLGLIVPQPAISVSRRLGSPVEIVKLPAFPFDQ